MSRHGEGVEPYFTDILFDYLPTALVLDLNVVLVIRVFEEQTFHAFQGFVSRKNQDQ